MHVHVSTASIVCSCCRLEEVVACILASWRNHLHNSSLQIYGKTSRRRAIAKLRQASDLNGASSAVPDGGNGQPCCALRDIMVNQAAEIHDQQHTLGALQSTAPKIASDTHNLSLIKLDVEKVSGVESVDRTQVPRTSGYIQTSESKLESQYWTTRGAIRLRRLGPSKKVLCRLRTNGWSLICKPRDHSWTVSEDRFSL